MLFRQSKCTQCLLLVRICHQFSLKFFLHKLSIDSTSTIVVAVAVGELVAVLVMS